MKISETQLLLNRLHAEQDQFEAFTKGMRVAFQHDGEFESFDDFESWLYGEWEEYREGRYD